jgi:hypothetical protein
MSSSSKRLCPGYRRADSWRLSSALLIRRLSKAPELSQAAPITDYCVQGNVNTATAICGCIGIPIFSPRRAGTNIQYKNDMPAQHAMSTD